MKVWWKKRRKWLVKLKRRCQARSIWQNVEISLKEFNKIYDLLKLTIHGESFYEDKMPAV